MKRKVNRVGTGTLTVSLPSKWTEQNHISLGSELEVKEEGGQITFSTTEIQRISRKVSFHINGLQHRGIRIYLYYAYKEGFDEIEVIFDNPETLARISKEVESLLGFEIIKQSENYCLIKNVASPLDSTFPDLINKAFQITLSMSEGVLKAFQEKDNKSLENIEKQELTQNKLTLASLRIINANQFKIKNCGPIYAFVSILEGVADQMKYICQYYKYRKISIDNWSEDYFKYYITTLKETYSEFLKHDEEMILNLVPQKKYLHTDACEETIEKCPKELRALITFLNKAGLDVCELKKEIYMISHHLPEGTKGVFDSINLI